MRLAPFVDDSNMFIVDLRQARIAIAKTFIQHQMVRGRPGISLVEAHLKHLVESFDLGMAVREQERTALLAVTRKRNVDQTAVATRLNECVSVSRMGLPRMSPVARIVDTSELCRVRGSGIHEQCSVTQFDHLAFTVSAGLDRSNLPRLAVVVTRHNSRESLLLVVDIVWISTCPPNIEAFLLQKERRVPSDS